VVLKVMMDAAGARHVGARLLGEVEEESLEEVRRIPANVCVNLKVMKSV
jgi:hypothetical protein